MSGSRSCGNLRALAHRTLAVDTASSEALAVALDQGLICWSAGTHIASCREHLGLRILTRDWDWERDGGPLFHTDPALRPMLADCHTTAARRRRAAVILSGEWSRQLSGEAARRRRLRTAKPQKEAARRRRACQEYLVDARRRGATVKDAVERLMDLHRSNRAADRRIVGSDRLYSEETFRGYWKNISPERP
jgi:hypothetical protein